MTSVTLRPDPLCRHYDPDPKSGCGGCVMQHRAPDDYIAWKIGMVTRALNHVFGRDIAINDMVITPPKTRWRTRLHAVRGVDDVIIGFQQRKSHNVIDMHECLVLHPSVFALIAPLRDFLSGVLSKRDTVQIQLTYIDGQTDILLLMTHELNMAARKKVADLCRVNSINRFAVKVRRDTPEIIIRTSPILKTIDDVTIELPMGGFLQASQDGENALIHHVMAAIDMHKPKRILDLFCGIGTFSFPLSSRKHIKSVQGYDSFTPAIDAYNGAARGHNLSNFIADTRDLFDLPVIRRELKTIDAVIIDPPRKGARDQMHQLAGSDVPLIVSVSCDPTTFARDAKILVDGGYTMQSITPVDQFIWSDHLEVIGTFTKVRAKKRRK